MVDRDDGLHFTEVAEVVDKLAQLRGRFDISSKKNKSPRLDVAEESGGFRIEFGSRNTDEQKLTRIVRWHNEGKPDFMQSVEMNSSQKIGLFGGSFDPVHHGHLIMARGAMESLDLERVVFIPANISPHKLESPPAPSHLRCEMLKAAIENEPGFYWDGCEIEREGPSFAVDTARLMQQRFPAAELFYFIGEDNVPALHTWKEIDALRRLVQFVVLARGSQPSGGEFPVISRGIDISSTDIRNRIAGGLPVSYLLPESTIQIIQQHHLYCND